MGRIKNNKGEIKFAKLNNNRDQALKFEFDPDKKVIYFDGIKSGKFWVKKKNYIPDWDLEEKPKRKRKRS